MNPESDGPDSPGAAANESWAVNAKDGTGIHRQATKDRQEVKVARGAEVRLPTTKGSPEEKEAGEVREVGSAGEEAGQGDDREHHRPPEPDR